MKVLTVVGARPQLIKASAVAIELKRARVKEVLVHTGQHYDDALSGIFFRELGIPEPAYHLGVGSASHAVATARMLERLEPVIAKEAPDWVLVYGDTNSTVAGALAAAKLHMPVAHVEAGLRSNNFDMPEEINRRATDAMSRLLFAPTRVAYDNLLREGHARKTVELVGDVMLDVAMRLAQRAETESKILKRLGLTPGGFILATIHRQENTDDQRRLAAILRGLRSSAKRSPVVLPIHPRTRKRIAEHRLEAELDTLTVIDPVGYLDMTQLERHARLIATDSGGVQKEAFFHGVPCVTLRDETEWTELEALGWNRVVPPVSSKAVAGGIEASLRAGPGRRARPYGSGDAARRIVRRLQRAS